MLPKAIRKFVIALTSLAFLGGATVQAAPPSMASTVTPKQMTSIPTHDCADMAADNTAAPMQVPCQGMTPECLKSMSCLGLLSLPVQPALISSPIHYERIAFWSEDEVPMGLAVEPLLFPPIPA